MKKFVYCYLTFTATTTLSAQPWQEGSLYATSSFIFAPGVLASEASMAMYCPSFIASTGERIECIEGIEVIKKPFTSSNFAEIHLQPAKGMFTTDHVSSLSHKLAWSPVMLLGYAGSRLLHRLYGIRVHTTSEKGDHSVRMYWINPRLINIGQEGDIKLLRDAYEKHQGCLPAPSTPENHAVILYGVSRGSATIINLMTHHNPANAKALVLEGLFDTMDSVSEHSPSMVAQAKIKLLALTNFNREGVVPAQYLEKLPRSLPILLITSRNDTTVPCQCTINIYLQLRAFGHEKVHLVILDSATHPRYSCSNRADKNRYQNTVHAFYRTYGLPYIKEYADLGQYYFEENSQPNF